MKAVYPVILEKGDQKIIVTVPDFDISTEGNDYLDAISMARDAICMVGLELENQKKPIPKPSDISSLSHVSGIVALADVDFSEYRRKTDYHSVRRNITIPAWMDWEARKANLNLSAVAQRALKAELHLS